MPKNTEIERKFLVLSEDYKKLATTHIDICQGYICKQPGRTVRVRVAGEKAYLTIKTPAGEGSFSRFEWEREITLDDAKALMSICMPGMIEKTRWIVPAAEKELKWEVDEFHGRLAGLTLAEIELESESQVFTKAPFLGEEVTGDPRYYNANM
ncbi:MAG: CYTH domain-containing protein [Paludibacteraceae bacterium]|nr:CYTH domain-containing protein [Paludibacteraceae bacterium]